MELTVINGFIARWFTELKKLSMMLTQSYKTQGILNSIVSKFLSCKKLCRIILRNKSESELFSQTFINEKNVTRAHSIKPKQIAQIFYPPLPKTHIN